MFVYTASSIASVAFVLASIAFIALLTGILLSTGSSVALLSVSSVVWKALCVGASVLSFAVSKVEGRTFKVCSSFLLVRFIFLTSN